MLVSQNVNATLKSTELALESMPSVPVSHSVCVSLGSVSEVPAAFESQLRNFLSKFLQFLRLQFLGVSEMVMQHYSTLTIKNLYLCMSMFRYSICIFIYFSVGLCPCVSKSLYVYVYLCHYVCVCIFYVQ